MGQKTNPVGLRLGITRQSNSIWFATDQYYADKLHEDLRIQRFLRKSLPSASVSKICIERMTKDLMVTIHSAKPGVVVGPKGAEISKLKLLVEKMVGASQGVKPEVSINVTEIKRPEIDASLVAESVAQQIRKRSPFRRAMKKAMQSAMKTGARGIKVRVSGRLNGAEIARSEWYKEGRIPLHTLRADVDYGFAAADTTYGVIGVKVWIYRGAKEKNKI